MTATNEHELNELASNMAKAFETSQSIWQAMLSRGQPDLLNTSIDPMGMGQAYLQMWAQMANDPASLWEKQLHFWQDSLKLWQSATSRLLGDETEEPQAEVKDRRFKDKAWQENTLFAFLKQSYLLTSRHIQQVVASTPDLDPHTARKLDFYTRQFVDAMSPSNFWMTNPEVLKATLESKGQNLVKGLENLLEDLQSSESGLRISMTDRTAFEIGKNLATSPGEVVYENELMQLIQFAPATETVHQTPILIMPAWINKYYILDLQKDNSLIGWLVAQGHTVFIISWVNPDEDLGRKSFDDYLAEGPLAALDAIEEATGETEVSVIGYCLGGTLLSITLSWLKANNRSSRVKSATYLTTMVDFKEAGELSVFIDEEQLQLLEQKMSANGYLEGSDMAMTFNLLRANDLIWSFVVNNYMLGKDPFPFDLLYWNADSTRMPATMHSFYLRNMYQKNRLIQKNGLEIGGAPIHLAAIDTPSYMISTKDDHIAPWKSTYAATQIYKGPIRFVLAGSGHIAGIVNPPSREKYGYWLNEDETRKGAYPTSPDVWLKDATEYTGSWWPDWNAWQASYAGQMVPARKIKHSIEPAPGRYVKVMG